MHTPPFTLDAFQKLISARYESTDRARGTDGTFVYFVEEVGELARAIARWNKPGPDHDKHRANLEEEFADVLAWLCTLANITDVNLTQAIERKYLSTDAPMGAK
jgi:NTP pyrophosphatase (non-canonical NTP hydrolase)